MCGGIRNITTIISVTEQHPNFLVEIEDGGTVYIPAYVKQVKDLDSLIGASLVRRFVPGKGLEPIDIVGV